MVATVDAAGKAAREGDSEAADGLKEFIRLVAGRATPEQVRLLGELVRLAGLDLRAVDGGARLLPLDDPVSPVTDAITALEADFTRLGMATAAGTTGKQRTPSRTGAWRPPTANYAQYSRR